MKRLVRTARRRLRLAKSVERFVRLIVAGGVALVAGLWIATLSGAGSPPRVLGYALALVGIGGLAAGIWIEIDY